MSDHEIQRFSGNDFARFLCHELLRQMDQQVRDKEYRIVLILTDVQNRGRSVFSDDHAMNSKWQRNIKILLYTAVVVRIKISQPAVLVERILLHVKARRIDVRAENIQAVLHRLLTDLKENNRLVHPYGINLVSRLQLLTAFDEPAQFAESLILSHIDQGVNGLTLGLCIVEKLLIVLAEIIYCFGLLPCIGSPCVFSVHNLSPLNCQLLSHPVNIRK